MCPAPPNKSPSLGLTSYGLTRRACNPASLILLFIALLIAAPVRAEPAIRIVAIGDSLMAGYGLIQGDGLVPKLQLWLDNNASAPAIIIDMGVSGDTTAGGRARIDWALADGAEAVIVELGANDMLRGIDPAVSRENLDAILTALAGRGLPVLLVGMRAAANYGPDYQAEYDAIFPQLAARHGTLLDPFIFEGLVGNMQMFQPDALHPNAQGVDVMVQRLGPLVLQLIERVRR
jgi:acyl-CoA thioesterase-1